MITRIFTVNIKPELRAEFEAGFRTTSVDAVVNQKGFVSAELGFPTRWAPDTYAMISKWEDEASLIAFVGEDWNAAVIPAPMEQFVIACDVVHFSSPS